MDRSSPLPAAGQPAPLPTQSTLRRAIGASALGNAVEWFDYGIYAYGVTYISAALFPGEEGVKAWKTGRGRTVAAILQRDEALARFEANRHREQVLERLRGLRLGPV